MICTSRSLSIQLTHTRFLRGFHPPPPIAVNDDNDIELLWISDEGLVVDDPEGWEKRKTKDDEEYYVHAVTGQVQWHHPHDYTYQQKYLKYHNEGGPVPAWWTEKRKAGGMDFKGPKGEIKLRKRSSSIHGEKTTVVSREHDGDNNLWDVKGEPK